jgi:Tol biopolymer transport system component
MIPVALGVLPVGTSAANAGPWTDQFVVQTNSYTFDHAPAFGPNNAVVSHHDESGAGMQVYISNLDGSNRQCVTCGAGEPAVPNMVPTWRPQGDKIMFHTWTGHNITFGGPGFGGLGSTFWVVNPDGSHPVQLTPPALGTEGMDNFHAYFSPDGNHIAWAHIDWNFVTPITNANVGSGTGKWSIYLADYVNDGSGPHLANVRQVRPENGHFYETQWWSPDGHGFLFTESSDTAVDLDLYFYDLTKPPGQEITRLTNNHTWTEQAIFTPDGKNVVYMSIKDHQNAWAAWSTPSNLANFPSQYDYVVLIPLFFGIFLTPGLPPACDLYEVNLATGQERRLTTDGDDGWIIPELTYSQDGKYLMWTELEVRQGLRVDGNPNSQPGDELSLLTQPPSVPSNLLDKGKELFYIVQRTRIGQFVDSTAVVPEAPHAFVLPLIGIAAAGLVLMWKGRRIRGQAASRPTRQAL